MLFCMVCARSEPEEILAYSFPFTLPTSPLPQNHPPDRSAVWPLSRRLIQTVRPLTRPAYQHTEFLTNTNQVYQHWKSAHQGVLQQCGVCVRAQMCCTVTTVCNSGVSVFDPHAVTAVCNSRSVFSYCLLVSHKFLRTTLGKWCIEVNRKQMCSFLSREGVVPQLRWSSLLLPWALLN